MADIEASREGLRRMQSARKEFEAMLRSAQESKEAAMKELQKSEKDLNALQTVDQTYGVLLRQVDSERYIVRASTGERYVVKFSNMADKELVPGTRIALDMTTCTITSQHSKAGQADVDNNSRDSPNHEISTSDHLSELIDQNENDCVLLEDIFKPFERYSEVQ